MKRVPKYFEFKFKVIMICLTGDECQVLPYTLHFTNLLVLLIQHAKSRMTGYEHFYFDWQFFIYFPLVLGWLFWRKNYHFRLKRQTKLPECTSRSNQWLVPLLAMDNERYTLGVWIVVHHITNTMAKFKATRSLNLTFTGLLPHILTISNLIYLKKP